jgi:hypothetical protein
MDKRSLSDGASHVSISVAIAGLKSVVKIFVCLSWFSFAPFFGRAAILFLF